MRSEAMPDLCVVGASEAGLAACMAAAALGLSCTLVDDGDPNGLVNPDLLLAALAHAAAERRHARFAAMNIRLVRGRARFADATTLMVDREAIRARRIFIATGGEQPSGRLAAGLPPGVRLDVADLARLDAAPRDLLVVGGGPQAVSTAQSLARLGTRVTLAAAPLLPGFDAELAAPLLARMRRDGVGIRLASLQVVHRSGTGVAATLTDGTVVAAAHLLLAEEKRPALASLDLDRAGIARIGDGLRLDAGLRTSRRHISAIGSAAGARSSAEGVAQAGHAVRGAFLPLPARSLPDLVPRITATEPQIASVGHVPDGWETRVWRSPLSQTGGGALLGVGEGQVKVTTDRRGRVLAAGLVGPQVAEMVPFWTLAISQRSTLAQLGSLAVPTPSLSESVRVIAVQDLGRRLASPWVRRVMRVARRLG